MPTKPSINWSRRAGVASDANLTEVLADLRRRFPEVPDRLWQQIEGHLRTHYGASRVYFEARKKKRQLEQIEAAGPEADAQRVSEILGVSVRHARRLRDLT